MISTPNLLGPLLGHGDCFVLIQNGVGVERELRSRLPTTTIVSGCAWIISTIIEKGRTLEQRGPVGAIFAWLSSSLTRLQERIALGVHPLPNGGSGEESLRLLTDVLLQGGATPEPQPNIVAERWRKVLW